MKEVWAFVDERKNMPGGWYYFLILLVPHINAQALKSRLKDAREGFTGCMKFSELHKEAKGEKVKIAKRWIREVLDNASESRNEFYFTLTGINTERMDPTRFGGKVCKQGETLATMHNRFFRKALSNAIKDFWRNEPVTVKRIFHDSEGNLQNHDFFDWHTITSTERDEENISFEEREVKFVSSNHMKEEKHKAASEMIQFVDILIGSMTYCFDVSNPKNKGQKEVALEIVELAKRMSESPKNKNSSYGYHRRYKVGFFPKKNSYSGQDELFYTKRPIKLLEHINENQELELC